MQAFRRTGEASFVPLGEPVPAGEATCHVAVAPDGGSLIASCWGDGRVVRMTLDAAGRPSSPVIAAAAADPYGARRDPSGRRCAGRAAGDIDLAAARALRAAAGDEFAHLVPATTRPTESASTPGTEHPVPPRARTRRSFLPGGLVATTDMGLDLVRFWRSTPTGLRQVQQVVLPHGSGPRHMVRHPSGHLYVVAELSCEVFVLAPDVSRRVAARRRHAPRRRHPPGRHRRGARGIRDGEFLYAGVRGSNTLATLQVRGEGESLAPVALVESGVDWPRHHVVVRDTLLVAGQRSDEVASLTLDMRTGVPGRVRHRADAPSPTCLVRAR